MAVPTRSTVNIRRQSPMLGETPAAWTSQRSDPSDRTQWAIAATESASVTSQTSDSTLDGATSAPSARATSSTA